MEGGVMATWRELILDEMKENSETWHDLIACTLSTAELDEEFDCGYGLSEGKPFTLWTRKRVYFPVVYDGSEWVGSVPRNPCNKATQHFGGQ